MTKASKRPVKKLKKKLTKKQIREKVASIYPESDAPRCSMFGGKDYFVP